jgi:hypothetical protein
MNQQKVTADRTSCDNKKKIDTKLTPIIVEQVFALVLFHDYGLVSSFHASS